MRSLIAGVRPGAHARNVDPRESRLFRFNDGVLIALLVVPQLVWLGLVAYLLNLHL